MPRELFSHQLQELEDDLMLLGSMVIEALQEAVEALKVNDIEAAKRIIAGDRQINAKKFEIEDDCLTLIATQQPMARDMRLIAAILEISGELERIGDYAKGISRIIIYLDGRPPVKPLIDIPRMSELAIGMLQRALEAFIARDVASAQSIPLEDDGVDALYNQINSELLTLLMSRPQEIEQANYLLWAAHNLERAADRVTNICERTIYTVTGQYREVDVSEFGYSGLE